MIDLTTLADLTPGICSVTLRSQGGIDDVVRISSDAGLAGIEWGGTDVHVSDSESAAHAKEATVAAGLSVLSLGSYYRCGAFEDFGRALDLATGLGAPPDPRVGRRTWLCRGQRGPLGCGGPRHPAYRRSCGRPRHRHRLRVPRQHPYRLPRHHPRLTEPGESPNVGTYWQPAVGLSDKQALESLHEVLPHLAGVHCFSWGGPEAERFPLRNRKLLWQTVTDVLRGNGKDMDIMLEFVEDDLPENVLNDAAFLHTITLGED